MSFTQLLLVKIGHGRSNWSFNSHVATASCLSPAVDCGVAVSTAGPAQVPSRILMGPGPANAYPRVLAAQSLPLLGHMHPPFFKIMDEIQGGLKYLFQTDLGNTLLISGTGHAGMEAAIANCIEPGEKIIVGNNGIWGMRVVDLAQRYGGDYSGYMFDTYSCKLSVTCVAAALNACMAYHNR